MNPQTDETPQQIVPPAEITIPPAQTAAPNTTIRPTDKSASLYGAIGTDPQGLEKIPNNASRTPCGQ